VCVCVSEREKPQCSAFFRWTSVTQRRVYISKLNTFYWVQLSVAVPSASLTARKPVRFPFADTLCCLLIFKHCKIKVSSHKYREQFECVLIRAAQTVWITDRDRRPCPKIVIHSLIYRKHLQMHIKNKLTDVFPVLCWVGFMLYFCFAFFPFFYFYCRCLYEEFRCKSL